MSDDEFAFAVNSLVVILVVVVENVSHAAAAMNFASVSEKTISDEEDMMSRYNIASSCPVGSCRSKANALTFGSHVPNSCNLSERRPNTWRETDTSAQRPQMGPVDKRMPDATAGGR